MPTDHTDAVNAVLDAWRGVPYEWGSRDCLSLCSDVVEAVSGTPLSAEWIARERARGPLIETIIASTAEYGTLALAYADLLQRHPHAAVVSGPARPGDIVVVTGPLRVDGVGQICVLSGATGYMLSVQADGLYMQIGNEAHGLSGLHRVTAAVYERYRFGGN